MRSKRRRYRLLAVAMLTAGFVMMASGAAQSLIIGQFLLAIVCAVASLRARGY
jgi:hypothetical protein